MTDDMYAKDTCFENMCKNADILPMSVWLQWAPDNAGCWWARTKQAYDTDVEYILPNQWRAISSVPKDSGGINPAPATYLLDTTTGIAIGFWSMPERAWLCSESYRRCEPTHFMPMPKSNQPEKPRGDCPLCGSKRSESERQEGLRSTSDRLKPTSRIPMPDATPEERKEDDGE